MHWEPNKGNVVAPWIPSKFLPYIVIVVFKSSRSMAPLTMTCDVIATHKKEIKPETESERFEITPRDNIRYVSQYGELCYSCCFVKVGHLKLSWRVDPLHYREPFLKKLCNRIRENPLPKRLCNRPQENPF